MQPLQAAVLTWLRAHVLVENHKGAGAGRAHRMACWGSQWREGGGGVPILVLCIWCVIDM